MSSAGVHFHWTPLGLAQVLRRCSPGFQIAPSPAPRVQKWTPAPAPEETATVLPANAPRYARRYPRATTDMLFSAPPRAARQSARLPAACARPRSRESPPAPHADNAARPLQLFSWAFQFAPPLLQPRVPNS